MQHVSPGNRITRINKFYSFPTTFYGIVNRQKWSNHICLLWQKFRQCKSNHCSFHLNSFIPHCPTPPRRETVLAPPPLPSTYRDDEIRWVRYPSIDYPLHTAFHGWYAREREQAQVRELVSPRTCELERCQERRDTGIHNLKLIAFSSPPVRPARR